LRHYLTFSSFVLKFKKKTMDTVRIKKVSYLHNPIHGFLFTLFSIIHLVHGVVLTFFGEVAHHFYWKDPPLFRLEDRVTFQAWGALFFILAIVSYSMNHMGRKQLTLATIGWTIASIVLLTTYWHHSDILDWKAFLFLPLFIGQTIELIIASGDIVPVHQAVSGTRTVIQPPLRQRFENMRDRMHLGSGDGRPLSERLGINRLKEKLRPRRGRTFDRSPSSSPSPSPSPTRRNYVDQYGYSKPIVQNQNLMSQPNIGTTGGTEYGTNRPIGVADTLRDNRELYNDRILDSRTDLAAHPSDYQQVYNKYEYPNRGYNKYGDSYDTYGKHYEFDRYPASRDRSYDRDYDRDYSTSGRKKGWFSSLFGGGRKKAYDVDEDHDYSQDYDYDRDYDRDYHYDDRDYPYGDRRSSRGSWFGRDKNKNVDRSSSGSSWFGRDKNKDKDVDTLATNVPTTTTLPTTSSSLVGTSKRDRDIVTEKPTMTKKEKDRDISKDVTTTSSSERPMEFVEEKTLKTPSKTKHSKFEKSVDSTGTEKVSTTTD
jgi:hypothetical protein